MWELAPVSLGTSARAVRSDTSRRGTAAIAITTTEAATATRTSLRTVRAWCRTGRLAAVKQRGRWAIRVSSLARLLCPVGDRLRKGVAARQLSARGLRRQQQRTAARRVASEHGTRVIGHRERARVAAANSGYILVRDYLASIGCEPAFIAKYESAAGRKIAQTYRANHGSEPRHGGIVILRGRLWRTMKYSDIRDLHAGACAYVRTRELMGLAS